MHRTRPIDRPTDAADVVADEEEDEGAYFLHGTYLDDLDRGDDDEDGDGLLEPHGCLPRLRVWVAGFLHPRRHSARVLSWAALDEHRYNPLY